MAKMNPETAATARGLAYAEALIQQLQDARTEIARLEEQYQTTRDLLEYRSEQYAVMSKVACEAEAERDDARGELTRLKAPQPCGHPGACIRVGEPWGDGNVHSCAWCADVEKLRGKLIGVRECGEHMHDSVAAVSRMVRIARSALDSTE